MPRTTESPTWDARRVALLLSCCFACWRCAERWLVAVTVRWSMANARRDGRPRWGGIDSAGGGDNQAANARLELSRSYSAEFSTGSVRLQLRDAFVTRAQQSRALAGRQGADSPARSSREVGRSTHGDARARRRGGTVDSRSRGRARSPPPAPPERAARQRRRPCRGGAATVSVASPTGCRPRSSFRLPVRGKPEPADELSSPGGEGMGVRVTAGRRGPASDGTEARPSTAHRLQKRPRARCGVQLTASRGRRGPHRGGLGSRVRGCSTVRLAAS